MIESMRALLVVVFVLACKNDKSEGDTSPPAAPPPVVASDDTDSLSGSERQKQPTDHHADPASSTSDHGRRVEARPPQEGPMCGNERCKPGEECITYRGIAGAKGPVFRECGIRCRRGQPRGGCPEGMRCVMIADGPGPVCR
jgi:hypothetical protein